MDIFCEVILSKLQKRFFFLFSIFETNKDRLLRNDLNYICIYKIIEILIEFNFNYRINT